MGPAYHVPAMGTTRSCFLPWKPLEQGDPVGGGTHWAEQGSDAVSPSQLG